MVTSAEPLKVFLYKDGLARFATEKYEKPNTKNQNNLFMHLTNYAINKKSDHFVQNNGEKVDRRGADR